jgi:hypothetical protein
LIRLLTMSQAIIQRYEAGEGLPMEDWPQVQPSWKPSILTEIYPCHACSHHEIRGAKKEEGGALALVGGALRRLVERCLTLAEPAKRPSFEEVAAELGTMLQKLKHRVRACVRACTLRRCAARSAGWAPGNCEHGASICGLRSVWIGKGGRRRSWWPMPRTSVFRCLSIPSLAPLSPAGRAGEHGATGGGAQPRRGQRGA